MSEPSGSVGGSDGVDYRVSPRKSGRTPKKSRRLGSETPPPQATPPHAKRPRTSISSSPRRVGRTVVRVIALPSKANNPQQRMGDETSESGLAALAHEACIERELEDSGMEGHKEKVANVKSRHIPDGQEVPIIIDDSHGDDEPMFVMPSTTNAGERLSASSSKMPTRLLYYGRVNASDESEEIYASMPSNAPKEVIARATKSRVTGEYLKISKLDNGLLRIISKTALMAHSESDTNFFIHRSTDCVVCQRAIEPCEMFLTFPDDLDRRRIWGNMLGYSYQDMLRIKARVGVMGAMGAICTDHFSEECLRTFNFNKATIEALGVPKHISPVKSPMKRRPWSCTICSFMAYSPYATQQHILLKHVHVDEADRPPLDGSTPGLACPFCRKCTYYYKTISGFRRHIESPPTEHCHLRRVYEIAREFCRSHCLEPNANWSSWSADNVATAYYGFVPPMPSSGKRKIPLASSHKQPLQQSTTASPEKKAGSAEGDETAAGETPKESEVPQAEAVVTEDGPIEKEAVEVEGEKERSEESGGVEGDVDEDDGRVPASEGGGARKTLADVLARVADRQSEERLESGIESIAAEPLDTSAISNSYSMFPHSSMGTAIRVTHRQLEAAEARARLFGETFPNELERIRPDDLAALRREKSFRDNIVATRRLKTVDSGVVSDLAHRRPLFAPAAITSPTKRAGILRPATVSREGHGQPGSSA